MKFMAHVNTESNYIFFDSNSTFLEPGSLLCKTGTRAGVGRTLRFHSDMLPEAPIR